MAKVLFGVCTLGGGHVYRDVAIGAELARLVPDAEIIYVSAGPTAEMLRAERLRVEDTLVEAPYFISGGRMHVLPTIFATTAAEALSTLRFIGLVLRHRPDLVIMDEVGLPGLAARLLGCRYAYLANFVFWPPPDIWRQPFTGLAVRGLINPVFRSLIRVANVSLYLGTPSHVPHDAWRAWAARHMSFVGPIGQGQVRAYPQRDEARARLGLGSSPVFTVTVGGGRAGVFLLKAAVDAWPAIRAALPDATLALVCGPAIQPEKIANPGEGLIVLGYTGDLLSYLAASDLAVVQAGISTVTECLEMGTPLIVYPVENHWEQQFVAEHAKAEGNAVVLSRQSVLDGELAATILRVMRDDALRARMAIPMQPAHNGDAALNAARLLAPLLRPAGERIPLPRAAWPIETLESPEVE